MKTRAAVLAVALLAGTLSACDAGDVPNRSSASEGDKTLCVWISSRQVGETTRMLVRLVEGGTDGVLVGLVYTLLNNIYVEAAPKNAVLRRCREIGAL